MLGQTLLPVQNLLVLQKNRNNKRQQCPCLCLSLALSRHLSPYLSPSHLHICSIILRDWLVWLWGWEDLHPVVGRLEPQESWWRRPWVKAAVSGTRMSWCFSSSLEAGKHNVPLWRQWGRRWCGSGRLPVEFTGPAMPARTLKQLAPYHSGMASWRLNFGAHQGAVCCRTGARFSRKLE